MGKILRGDIFWANLEPVKGSEQGGTRPVLIIQNNVANEYSTTTIIAPITSKIPSKKYPTNIFLSKKDSKLNEDSTIMFNQIRTIDKLRITKKVSSLNYEFMKKVDLAIKISLGLD